MMTRSFHLALAGLAALAAVACASSGGQDEARGGAGGPAAAGSNGAAGITGVSGHGGSGGAVTGTAGQAGDNGVGGAGGASVSGTAGSGGRAGGTAGEGRGGETVDAGAGADAGGRGGAAGAYVGGRGGAGSSGRGGTSAGGGSGGATGGSGPGGAGGAPVTLPPGVTALFPPPGGQMICPDPTLRLTFSGPPTLGNTGKVQVFSAAGTMVASVDMAASTVTDTIGGTTFILLRPAFVDGNTAVIYLKTKALAYGQTYYVTVDAGAIRPPGGGNFSITGANSWRFSTAAAAPGSLTTLSVALDGGGQFCTIQGATDALPANNTAAARITISDGTYHEIVHVSKKSNLTLHGQSRHGTIVAGTNNNSQQTGNNPGTANRALVSFDGTNGLVIENLTIQNLTPQGGSQAEALRMQTCDKCVVRDADIRSLQDTLLWSGRIYAENCLIEGNVDYVWGTGVAYFNKCEIRTVGRTGVIVQARNGTGAYGYVFVDSKLTTDAASKNNLLARIDVSVYPGSHVAYINCQMSNVASAGWEITGGSAGSSLRFWEYQSTDASGNPLSVGGRTGGTQISASQAAMMRDPTVVLGGWSP
jgi:hypothetical protein